MSAWDTDGWQNNGAFAGGRRGAALGALCLTVLVILYVAPVARLAHSLLPGFEFSRVDRLSRG